MLENPETKQVNPPIDGQRYVFVTMPGTGPAADIRVCPMASGGHGHAQVSGNAPYVRYAGEVIFKDGKETHATPQSGTYLPPLENARTLSGLNCEFTSKFPSDPDQTK
ncbi:hypothetical protein RY831_27890 [Noviherbaspirillum sp. CPCC 100848]|uniref:Tox-PAAR-like domain-containing protein n=1 Tax=Noviherbaspirillum album TaxID=3080276 RepID=A0ABU6JH51_9BURK|nr:hypothetical protein [Noviherbaspirillum sp. CPCC 100848]MEC4722986.1 hypothetical protein [Noviherbaspirillum sp. CPCC 100848]